MFLQNENFTIYEVENLKNDCIAELQRNEIIVDMKNVAKIDIAAVSLLLSLKKSATAQNKKFKLQNCNYNILMALSICGCDAYLGV